MSEGLFNFVIGWTLMFAPLLFTDRKRDRYKSSLDVLWGLQMFLTNTFLIPYMAIRLNEADADSRPSKLSPLGSVMTNGAAVVGLIGGAVCVFSAIWALYGRMDGEFGNITDRWQFLPWLIGENLQNVEKSKVGVVSYLRFIPVVGLVAYLLFLNLADQ
ncbi:Protein UL20 [Gossypium arboreum]|uniref:Protein UL20 n=1 Tax=Gossypium arboreum TaxID=29729 RepID=A0A0B0PGL8_GOSAR|nr:Protein UL20 [Gossypium arboreum]